MSPASPFFLFSCTISSQSFPACIFVFRKSCTTPKTFIPAAGSSSDSYAKIRIHDVQLIHLLYNSNRGTTVTQLPFLNISLNCRRFIFYQQNTRIVSCLTCRYDLFSHIGSRISGPSVCPHKSVMKELLFSFNILIIFTGEICRIYSCFPISSL